MYNEKEVKAEVLKTQLMSFAELGYYSRSCTRLRVHLLSRLILFGKRLVLVVEGYLNV